MYNPVIKYSVRIDETGMKIIENGGRKHEYYA